jgi:hypothetical protein
MYDPRLKPCPFCGSDRLIEFIQRVHCWGCSTDGPFQYSMVDSEKQAEGVRNLWNQRVQLMDKETR